MPEAALLIVGPGSEIERQASRYLDDPDVLFNGPCPPEEIPLYFNALDVGVLPFELSEFTHSALPLKVIEYPACGKPDVSTPLQGFMELGFPNVSLAEPVAEARVDVWLATHTHNLDSNELSQRIEGYDWGTIVERMKNAIELQGGP